MATLGKSKLAVQGQSTAPANPINGQVWYDSTSNNTFIYDGTEWQMWIAGGNYGSQTNPITAATLSLFDGDAGSSYWINTPNGATGSAEYSGPNFLGTGKKYFKMWEAAYNSAPTTNLILEGHYFNEILIQNSGGTWHNAIFDTHRPYVATASTVASSGGSRTGYRVFLGASGGHGIYNTSQQPCNWGDSGGAWGAGYVNSTCGSWPNGLLMGSGTSGSPTYTGIGGTWTFWITF